MKPTKIQKAAIKKILAATRPVVWLGAVRAGKTVGACMALVAKMKKTPGTYLIGAFTYGNIDRNILPPLKLVLDGEGVEYELSRRMPYRMGIEAFGSEIWFVSGADESSQKAIQGMTVQGSLVDEVLLIPQSFVMQLVARMSLTDPMFIMTANKSSPNHWIKSQWIDEGRVDVIESVTTDNPHISKKTLDWYGNLLTGVYRDRMLGNEWSSEGWPVAAGIHWREEDWSWPDPENLICAAFLDITGTSALVFLAPDEAGYTVVGSQDFTGTELLRHLMTQRFVGRVIGNDCEAMRTLRLGLPVHLVATKETEVVDAFSRACYDGKISCNTGADTLVALKSDFGAWLWKPRGKAEVSTGAAMATAYGVYGLSQSSTPFSPKGKIL